MTRKSKSGNALKHATGLMKVQYMNQFVELRDTIRESNDTEACPICGGKLNGRPLFMVGKYDYCYNCYMDKSALAAYEEQRTNERAAQKRMDMIADITREIRSLSTSDEYIAWFEAAPEEGFFSAACDKLLSMKRPASFQDGRVDVTKYFNGIPATASKTWTERHLNILHDDYNKFLEEKANE